MIYKFTIELPLLPKIYEKFLTEYGASYKNYRESRVNQGCTIPGGVSGVPHMKILGRRPKINIKMKNFEDK